MNSVTPVALDDSNSVNEYKSKCKWKQIFQRELMFLICHAKDCQKDIYYCKGA